MKNLILIKKFLSVIISLSLIITSLPAELPGRSFLALPGNTEILYVKNENLKNDGDAFSEAVSYIRYYRYYEKGAELLTQEEVKRQGLTLFCVSEQDENVFLTNYQGGSQMYGSYATCGILGPQDVLFTEDCKLCVPIILIEKNKSPAFRNMALIHHNFTLHGPNTLADFIRQEQEEGRFKEFLAIISHQKEYTISYNNIVNLLNSNGGELFRLIRPSSIANFRVKAHAEVRRDEIIIGLRESITGNPERETIKPQWSKLKRVSERYGGSTRIKVRARSLKIDNRTFSLINKPGPAMISENSNTYAGIFKVNFLGKLLEKVLQRLLKRRNETEIAADQKSDSSTGNERPDLKIRIDKGSRSSQTSM